MSTRQPGSAASSRTAGRIIVRPADLGQSADARGLLAVLDAYAQDAVGDGRPLSAETRACLIPALRRVPGALVLLALADGGDGGGAAAVGAAVCFTGFSTFRARTLINIHDLAVLPAWRGQGIGRRLLAAVEAIARARGCCKVTLEVRADNAAARRLYDRLGYGAGASAEVAAQYLFLEKRLSD